MEGLVGGLGSGLFLGEQTFEALQLLRHVLVDLHVAADDHLHLVHVVVDVTVFGVLALDVLYELALLCDHVRNLLKILEVI